MTMGWKKEHFYSLTSKKRLNRNSLTVIPSPEKVKERILLLADNELQTINLGSGSKNKFTTIKKCKIKINPFSKMLMMIYQTKILIMTHSTKMKLTNLQK